MDQRETVHTLLRALYAGSVRSPITSDEHMRELECNAPYTPPSDGVECRMNTVETGASIVKRVAHAIERIECVRSKNDVAFVVTHGGVIREMSRQIAGLLELNVNNMCMVGLGFHNGECRSFALSVDDVVKQASALFGDASAQFHLEKQTLRRFLSSDYTHRYVLLRHAESVNNALSSGKVAATLLSALRRPADSKVYQIDAIKDIGRAIARACDETSTKVRFFVSPMTRVLQTFACIAVPLERTFEVQVIPQLQEYRKTISDDIPWSRRTLKDLSLPFDDVQVNESLTLAPVLEYLKTPSGSTERKCSSQKPAMRFPTPPRLVKRDNQQFVTLINAIPDEEIEFNSLQAGPTTEFQERYPFMKSAFVNQILIDAPRDWHKNGSITKRYLGLYSAWTVEDPLPISGVPFYQFEYYSYTQGVVSIFKRSNISDALAILHASAVRVWNEQPFCGVTDMHVGITNRIGMLSQHTDAQEIDELEERMWTEKKVLQKFLSAWFARAFVLEFPPRQWVVVDSAPSPSVPNIVNPQLFTVLRSQREELTDEQCESYGVNKISTLDCVVVPDDVAEVHAKPVDPLLPIWKAYENILRQNLANVPYSINDASYDIGFDSSLMKDICVLLRNVSECILFLVRSTYDANADVPYIEWAMSYLKRYETMSQVSKMFTGRQLALGIDTDDCKRGGWCLITVKNELPKRVHIPTILQNAYIHYGLHKIVYPLPNGIEYNYTYKNGVYIILGGAVTFGTRRQAGAYKDTFASDGVAARATG